MAIQLKGTTREAGKNLTTLRSEGNVPAVVYGAGRETASIAVSLRDFVKVHKAAGESGTVELELPTGKVTVLIHEVAHFVGNNPDSATEWDLANYAALTPQQAITNPSSFGAFAHHVSPGGNDLRFGTAPWI